MDDYCAARSGLIPPLPWKTFSPAFSRVRGARRSVRWGLFSRRRRKHGGPKRWVWRKVHLGTNEQTLEIRAVEVTGGDVGDAPMISELYSQIPPDQEVARVTADGA